jgi:NAD(P)-dependent dehydrogenase (short-subunit alcohol dehydrogenase family)
VEVLAATVRDTFGPPHIVFNNAGIGPLARIEDLTAADWQWMLGVNLWGVIHGILAFLPMLIASRQPSHIVNTSSLAGLSTQKLFGAYSVSKYGVVALSETLAAEMADDHPQIGVSVLCPGPVRTELEESTRNRPSSLAGALADIPLSHDKSRGPIPYITPADAAEIVLEAISSRRLYAITHTTLFERLNLRLRALEAAFKG